MKKRTILYGMLLAVGTAFTSCSDQFLEDMSPYDKYSAEKTFGVESNLDQYIQNLYYNYFYKSGMTPTQSYGLAGLWNDNTDYTEEKWGIRDKISPSNDYYKASDCDTYFGTNLASNLANNPYTRIRSCNEVLEGIVSYGQKLSTAAISKAKGQVYFLRAFQLFDLVRVYGSVPIVNKVLDATDREGAKAYVREKVEKCVEQIVADLDSAANYLPTRKGWGDAQYGRLTKEAALAYKSRVLLVYASPIFNTDWNNSSNQRWKDALKATLDAKSFLDSEGYGLEGSSAKDWNKMFYNYDNKFCKEVIMVKMMAATENTVDQHSSWQKSIRLKTMGGSGSGYMVPQGMIDIFPMADGTKATNDQGNAINGYDKFLFFKNRDPRFYYTFTFSGEKWGYDKDANTTVWNYRWIKDAKKNYLFAGSLTGSCPALVRKMSDPAENSANTYQYDGTDIYEYRYAELLLNLAECYAATGNAGEAVKLIGNIRKRVGIPAGDGTYGVGSITDKNEAIKACLRERQIELAYEGKRYWDIWRWMLYNDDATDNNNTCSVLGISQLNNTYRVGKVLHVKNYVGGNDPLTSSIAAFTPIDLDKTTDLQGDLTKLGEFWTQNFDIVDTDTPVDNVNNTQAVITWRQNYYLSGLPENVLQMNPWLLQSKGWHDAYGVFGTFNAKE
nr:RagB/SusD family nutrient uptake outer membrane protein [uncultured Bacteroides sp.]